MVTRVTQSLDDGRTTFRARDPEDEDGRSQAEKAADAPGSLEVIDPVCGMRVEPNSPNVVRSDSGGGTYCFCSQSCKARFEQNPEEFISATP